MDKILIIIIFILTLIIPAFAESYKTLKDVDGKDYIKRVSDKALIPCNTDNKDYLQYLEDKKKGAEVKPYDYEAEELRQKIEQDKLKEGKVIEDLIQNKIRELAVSELKNEGKIDINWKDPNKLLDDK